MTDQDPTQAYQPPTTGLPEVPPATPVAPPAYAAPAAYAPPAAPSAPGYAAPEAPAPLPVATMPVETAAAAKRPGRSMIKWVIAAVVVLLVAGTAAGATLLLTSDSGDPAVLAWSPADSVAYSELRLDLPGSQSAELAKVMKAFPGFEDQAAFPVKLSEALDVLVGQATDGKQSWKTDIEPWFGGQVGGSVGPIPTKADPTAARFVLLVSTKDAAKATAWVDGLVKQDAAATTTTETYNGATITVVTPTDGSVKDLAGMKAAYTVVGPVLALGDLTSVKAVIDTQGKTGLATNAQFKEASASLTGDRLGFFYADVKAISAAAESLAGQAGAEAAMPSLPAFLDDWTTPWVAAAVRAESGAFVVDTRSPHVEAAGAPKNSESKLPGLVPPTTVILAEGHDVGATLATLKAELAKDPELADAVKQVDDALAIVGGFDAATGWMGEVGVAITRDGETIGGGLVVTPTDAAAAEKLMNQLKAFVQLGGAQAGITVTDEDYNGTTITVVDLSGLGGLVGGLSEGAVEAPADLKIAYTVTDEVVALGYGTDFVKGVLDARTGASLAETERFTTALAQAGTSHASLFWLDIAGVRDFVEGMVPSDMKGDYDANAKPYLQAFDSLIATQVPGETIDSGTMVIRVTGS
ncbi:MAG TPA: DUF3352 domain-containing protein [Candidatus Limnocylindrales bacterium]|nr:DUF3352 domain-containing protein [Candidatus Limnocylindrales bacterium]